MGGACTTSAKTKHTVSVPCTGKPFYSRIIEAAARGDILKVAEFLAQGANVNSHDGTGRSALHLACAEGHTDVARILIAHGADLYARDRWGREPLQECILNGHQQLKDLLVLAGARISKSFLAASESRLRHAAAFDDVDIVRNLVKSGIDIDATDCFGRSALHIAAERGNFDTVQCLIDCGADAHLKDASGTSVAAIATKSRAAVVVRALSQAGAEPAATADRKPRKASFAIMEACARPIALATLEGRRIEPISRTCASLFVSDVVGFTVLCARLEPRKVARMLNDLYERFDRLAHVHGVQKIDMIGDAYIAAANLTEDQPDDHAARIARFAAAAVAAAAETPVDPDAPHRCVQIRVGLHSGPVAAAVVGQHDLKYTLMGEGVPVAARMESEGLPGRVHCSAACAALIAAQSHEFVLQPRFAPRSAAVTAAGAAPPPAPASYWVTRLRNGWRHFRSCPDLYSAAAAATNAGACDVGVEPAADATVPPPVGASGSQLLLMRSTSAPRLTRQGTTSPRAELRGSRAADAAGRRRAGRQQRRAVSICEGAASAAAGPVGAGHGLAVGFDCRARRRAPAGSPPVLPRPAEVGGPVVCEDDSEWESRWASGSAGVCKAGHEAGVGGDNGWERVGDVRERCAGTTGLVLAACDSGHGGYESVMVL